MGSKYHLYTAVSRKVVGKSIRDNPERYCEWFWVLCSLKKFERMAREAMDVCLRVLKKATKVGFIASVSGTVYWSYRHITFQDCRVHNLYRNSCIFIALTIEKKLACWPAICSSFSGEHEAGVDRETRATGKSAGKKWNAYSFSGHFPITYVSHSSPALRLPSLAWKTRKITQIVNISLSTPLRAFQG